jgi:adenine-specific DNA-methyltransferase
MSLNYIGSKKTLIEFLEIPIKKIISNNDNVLTLLDGFAGTGIVGMYFKNKYKNLKVIANDLEYYSYIINYAQLCVPYTNKLKDLIIKLNQEIQKPIVLKDDFKLISDNYSLKGTEKRMFWTEENATICDHIMYLLKNEDINDDEYKFLLASLLCSMDKVANTASVYGAFLKKFKSSANNRIELKPIHNNEFENNSKVFNVDINSNDILDKEYDIVYLDPPYNERQYSKNYFPLNLIATTPSLCLDSVLKGKTGIPSNCFISSFCKKGEVEKSFDFLFRQLKTKWIVLSYNSESLLSKEKILELMSKYGNATFVEKNYKRFKSYKYNNDVEIKEYLFILNKFL